jgi:thiol-disulfide isomerase/thioredoxin
VGSGILSSHQITQGIKPFQSKKLQIAPSGRLLVKDKNTRKIIEPTFEPSIILIEDPFIRVKGPTGYVGESLSNQRMARYTINGIASLSAVVENKKINRSMIVVITLMKLPRSECYMNSIENCTLIETEQDLKKILRTKNIFFILFYADWCPFSQRFLPIFENCIKDTAHTCYRMIIDKYPGLCEKYSVAVYPTVLFFKNGKAVKRLDGTYGVGLNEKQFRDLINACPNKKLKQKK